MAGMPHFLLTTPAAKKKNAAPFRAIETNQVFAALKPNVVWVVGGLLQWVVGVIVLLVLWYINEENYKTKNRVH